MQVVETLKTYAWWYDEGDDVAQVLSVAKIKVTVKDLPR